MKYLLLLFAFTVAAAAQPYNGLLHKAYRHGVKPAAKAAKHTGHAAVKRGRGAVSHAAHAIF